LNLFNLAQYYDYLSPDCGKAIIERGFVLFRSVIAAGSNSRHNRRVYEVA